MQEFEGPVDYEIFRFLATALDGVLERLSMRWFGDALLTERRHRCSLLNKSMQRPMPIFRNRASVQGWKVAKSAVSGNGCENYFFTVSSVSLREHSNFAHLQFIVELESFN